MVNANKPLDAAVDLAIAVVRFFCVFNHWRVGTTWNHSEFYQHTMWGQKKLAKLVYHPKNYG